MTQCYVGASCIFIFGLNESKGWVLSTANVYDPCRHLADVFSVGLVGNALMSRIAKANPPIKKAELL